MPDGLNLQRYKSTMLKHCGYLKNNDAEINYSGVRVTSCWHRGHQVAVKLRKIESLSDFACLAAVSGWIISKRIPSGYILPPFRPDIYAYSEQTVGLDADFPRLPHSELR